MAVGGGGDKVAAAYARRGSFLRTGIQSGVLAGQGGKSGRQRLPTATPRSRRDEKPGRGGLATCRTALSGWSRRGGKKREKVRCGSRKVGASTKVGGTAKICVQHPAPSKQPPHPAQPKQPWRPRSSPSGVLLP